MDYSKNGGSSYTTYFYATNAQGDVEGLFQVILNTSNGKYEQLWYGRYTYDAWGNVTATTASGGTPSATSVIVRNPIRYRGYVYDNETGWYYLQSRYYDPANHRFINADSYASTGQGFTGTNMFAYCNNSPILYTDPSGSIAGEGIIIGIIGLTVMLLLSGCESEQEENWPEDCPYDYHDEGRLRTDDNCYSYVFGYGGVRDPGDDSAQPSYTYEKADGDTVRKFSLYGIRNSVLADASVRGRRVEDITTVYTSGFPLPDGAYLVVCKLADDRTDYHFAVLLPNGDWVDKPGANESRYNKINGFDDEWYACGYCYNSAPLYFLYWPEQ